MKSVWKTFYYYAPTERRAMLFLLGIILLLYNMPTRLLVRETTPLKWTKAERAWVTQHIEIKEKMPKYLDSVDVVSVRQRTRFNPNEVTEAFLLQMGLPARLAKTWHKYLEKGGRFNSPQDLRKIYGMSDRYMDMLLPYMDIPIPSKKFARQPYKSVRTTQKCRSIEVNSADSVAWEMLPGIGSVLAARIIRFRDKLGGFVQLEQIGETYGLKDSTFQRILPCLTLEVPARMIPINEASFEVLAAHPYIGYKVAKIMVAYRKANGPFAEPDDLLAIPAWEAPVRSKALLYLKF